jgi:hypothetical protein
MGQVVQSAMAMATGFSYVLLGAALMGIGIIFAALLKQQGQARVLTNQSLVIFIKRNDS